MKPFLSSFLISFEFWLLWHYGTFGRQKNLPFLREELTRISQFFQCCKIKFLCQYCVKYRRLCVRRNQTLKDRSVLLQSIYTALENTERNLFLLKKNSDYIYQLFICFCKRQVKVCVYGHLCEVMKWKDAQISTTVVLLSNYFHIPDKHFRSGYAIISDPTLCFREYFLENKTRTSFLTCLLHKGNALLLPNTCMHVDHKFNI
jgi:hypothetical protein